MSDARDGGRSGFRSPVHEAPRVREPLNLRCIRDRGGRRGLRARAVPQQSKGQGSPRVACACGKRSTARTCLSTDGAPEKAPPVAPMHSADPRVKPRRPHPAALYGRSRELRSKMIAQFDLAAKPLVSRDFDEHNAAPRTPPRSWSWLLGRVFAIDVESCHVLVEVASSWCRSSSASTTSLPTCTVPELPRDPPSRATLAAAILIHDRAVSFHERLRPRIGCNPSQSRRSATRPAAPPARRPSTQSRPLAKPHPHRPTPRAPLDRPSAAAAAKDGQKRGVTPVRAMNRLESCFGSRPDEIPKPLSLEGPRLENSPGTYFWAIRVAHQIQLAPPSLNSLPS